MKSVTAMKTKLEEVLEEERRKQDGLKAHVNGEKRKLQELEERERRVGRSKVSGSE